MGVEKLSGKSRFDVVIIGAGLAGTTLAWALRWRGQRVLVIDREEAVTSSRIAAGLKTPITGSRLAVTWRIRPLFESATQFYRRIETESAETVFHPRPAVRLFSSAAEAEILARKGDRLLGEIEHPEPLVNPDWFAVPHGGFVMPRAARLDVPRYLSLSRSRFAADGGYLAQNLDPANDIVVSHEAVTVPALAVESKRLVFCIGYEREPNPWFPEVPFRPAKGEILTLRIPGLSESRVVHAHGVWLVPWGGERFRLGATYELTRLDPTPTPEAREELLAKLGQFLRLPVEVLEHDAAIRPIVGDRKPVLGTHPEQPRIGYLNGLASKGSLTAPFFAAMLADHLLTGAAIDPEVDVQKYRRAFR